MKSQVKKHYEKAEFETVVFLGREVLNSSDPFASDSYDDVIWFNTNGGK